MIVEYVVFNIASGEVLRNGHASEDMVAMQAGAGERAIVIPAGVTNWNGVNLEPLREKMLAEVEAGAGWAREQFITVSPGQAAVYARKLREAEAWQTGNDPASAPFLSQEAAATGVTIGVLADVVLAAEARWITAGAAIEAARMGAKIAIGAAETLPAIVTAASVDWVAVVSAAG